MGEAFGRGRRSRVVLIPRRWDQVRENACSHAAPSVGRRRTLNDANDPYATSGRRVRVVANA